MKIRRATPDDARAIKEVHVSAYKVSYRGYLPDDALDAMCVDEDVVARTAAFIKTHEYWVAEKDRQVVGVALIEYPEDKTQYEILMLYVHPAYQRTGAGSALVNFLCAQKKELGYQKLVLWTLKDGPSIGFYQKMGLTQTEGKEKMWKYNQPIIQFEKDL